MTSLNNLLGVALGGRRKSQFELDAERKERSDYGKAKRLAAKLGMVIEIDRTVPPSVYKIAVAGPDFTAKTGLTEAHLDEMLCERMCLYWSEMLDGLRYLEEQINTA